MRKIMKYALITFLITGCASKNTDVSSSQRIQERINISYQNNMSWMIEGKGMVVLEGMQYRDGSYQQYFVKEYDLNENEVMVSCTFDKDMNLSFYDSFSQSTELYQNSMKIINEEIDTGYTQTEKLIFEDNESYPLLLKCKNMKSIPSDFIDDYQTLDAEWSFVLIAKKVNEKGFREKSF